MRFNSWVLGVLSLVLCTSPFSFALAQSCAPTPVTCPDGTRAAFVEPDSSDCQNGGYQCVLENSIAASRVTYIQSPLAHFWGEAWTLVSRMFEPLSHTAPNLATSQQPANTAHDTQTSPLDAENVSADSQSAAAATPGTAGKGIYGKADGSSKEFVSSEPTPVATVDFVTTDLSHLRAWIGNSECASCTSGTTKTQTFSFSNLSQVSKITIRTVIWYASADFTLKTTVSGDASITGGATVAISAASQPIIWTTTIVPHGTPFSITLGNGAKTGTKYAQIDQYTITPTIQPTGPGDTPTSTSTPCTFAGLSVTSGTSVTAYQASTVPASASCLSETRTCTNGTLTGSFTNTSCSVQANATSTASLFVPNAIAFGTTTIPAYKTPEGLVGYKIKQNVLTSYGADGAVRWQKSVNADTISGGSDIDGDSYPDLIAAGKTGTGCNDTSWATLVSGKSGTILQKESPLPAETFNTTNSCTFRWYVGSLMIGPGSLFALLPQYYSTGWFVGPKSGSLNTIGYFYSTSEASYDSYSAAKTISQFSYPSPFTSFPMEQNGLLVGTGASARYIAFTSGRVLQYLIQPYSTTQLLSDTELVSGGPRGGGRNYGLVSTVGTSKVALVSGTDASELLLDVQSGSRSHDPYGGLLRHFAIYDFVHGTVQDRFYSWAHDNNDANEYVNRVAYPTHAVVTIGSTQYIFFNVFDGARWYISVNDVNLKEVAKIYDRYVWDTLRRTDGQYRLLYSTTSGYWPVKPHKTEVGTYTNGKLVSENTLDGFPRLAWSFKEPGISSSNGGLFSALVTTHGVVMDPQ